MAANRSNHKPIVQVVPDGAALARTAADLFVRFVQEAIVSRGRATVALSGGSTPQKLYALLAGPPNSTRLDFSAIDFFFVDERCVPPDDSESNYCAVNRLLFRAVGVAAEKSHRIRGELAPVVAAVEYEAELRSCFRGGWPQFDLVLLGLGADGHTASIFPGEPTVSEREAWVVHTETDHGIGRRVTLTMAAINHARQILFLVDGAEKADVVARVLGGARELPASRVRPATGECRWLITQSAAFKLPRLG
ncbi:MAG: 6-phosphogluconolactonase [Phycisphaerae bacterium]|nr:6-phosphogluconolactonase [Phycisphaerae bacterium]